MSQSMARSFVDRLGLTGLIEGRPVGPTDILASTLQSRFVARNVVQKLDLVRLFRTGGRDEYVAVERATNQLLERSSVDVSDMLLISIEVTYRDPKIAADIANAFVDELEKANQQFSLSSAGGARRFVEERRKQTESALVDAQKMLIEFQKQHGAVVLDEQSKATVEAIANLEGQVIALQAKRDALSTIYTPSHSKIRELDLSIAALRRKVGDLTASGATPKSGSRVAEGARGAGLEEGVLIPLGQVPAIAAEYARLLLDVKTQEQVLELLVQQHEQLKIEEAKNTPTIQVLDRAFPPIKKSRPLRKVIMLAAALIGLIGSIALALLLNYLEKEFDTARIEELKGMRESVVRELRSRLPGRRS